MLLLDHQEGIQPVKNATPATQSVLEYSRTFWVGGVAFFVGWMPSRCSSNSIRSPIADAIIETLTLSSRNYAFGRKAVSVENCYYNGLVCWFCFVNEMR